MTSSPPPAKADKPLDQPLAIKDELEFSYELKIPKDRVAVLIGPKGKKKRELESYTKTSIKIDSKEGDVLLTGKDSLSLYALREVVRAIGRGFNPEVAQLLLKQDYVLEVISMMDFARNKNDNIRLRGRVIGADGKARTTIEKLTETLIVVYGKTVGIIGTTEQALLARRACESLLEGGLHANVYRWLENSRRQMKKNQFRSAM